MGEITVSRTERHKCTNICPSFKVILIDAGRNPEWCVVIMYNNADIISETHEHIAMGKLQIRRIK